MCVPLAFSVVGVETKSFGAEVLKSLGERMLTAKAYCGRVITEWLSYVLGVARLGPLRNNLEIQWAAVTLILQQQINQFDWLSFFGKA